MSAKKTTKPFYLSIVKDNKKKVYRFIRKEKTKMIFMTDEEEKLEIDSRDLSSYLLTDKKYDISLDPKELKPR